jgi:Spy/CpxP family protein refolding chaperone
MTKKTSGVLIAFMMMGTLVAAKGSGEWHGREDMQKNMKAELNLTDEQEMKLETHRIDQRAAMEKLKLEIKQKREALRAELEKPTLDKGQVRKLNERLKTSYEEMSDQRLEGILYVRSVLTPEQFKKFMAMRPDPKDRKDKGDMKGKDGSRKGHGRSRDDSRKGAEAPPPMEDDHME